MEEYEEELRAILHYLWNESFNASAQHGSNKYGKRKENAIDKVVQFIKVRHESAEQKKGASFEIKNN